MRVHEVLFEGDRAVGVQHQGRGRRVREVRAKVVVDASGQNGLLHEPLRAARLGSDAEQGRDLDLLGRAPIATPAGTKARRWSSRTADKKGWFWYIPLHDDIVSVGVVAPFDYLFKGRDGPRADLRRGGRELPGRQGARRQRARASTGYFATKDYSYRSKQVAGDGWVLVGDAFGFLDPLYSSGVLLALKSGELAADAIVEGLRRTATPRRRSSASGDRASTRAWTACAGWSASTTTGSASATWSVSIPEMRGTLTDLLIGDLFHDRVDKVWAPLESLYRPGRSRFPTWDAGTPAAEAGDKANELVLPEGLRPGL